MNYNILSDSINSRIIFKDNSLTIGFCKILENYEFVPNTDYKILILFDNLVINTIRPENLNVYKEYNGLSNYLERYKKNLIYKIINYIEKNMKIEEIKYFIDGKPDINFTPILKSIIREEKINNLIEN